VTAAAQRLRSDGCLLAGLTWLDDTSLPALVLFLGIAASAQILRRTRKESG